MCLRWSFERSWLFRLLQNNSENKFKKNYWNHLQRYDFLLFTSEKCHMPSVSCWGESVQSMREPAFLTYRRISNTSVEAQIILNLKLLSKSLTSSLFHLVPVSKLSYGFLLTLCKSNIWLSASLQSYARHLISAKCKK